MKKIIVCMTMVMTLVFPGASAIASIDETIPVVIPPASCPFTTNENTTIVNFTNNEKIVSSPISAPIGYFGETSAYTLTLLSAHYKVSLSSYDAYADRINTSQPHEQWFAKLLDSSSAVVTTTGATSDLQDNVVAATSSEVVNNDLLVSADVSSITGYHAFYPDDSSPNSVVPVCAAFEKIADIIDVPPVTPPATTTPPTTPDPIPFTPSSVATTVESGQVLGDETDVPSNACGVYLTTYMRKSKVNDIQDVARLQLFLNEYLKSGLPVNGNFDSQTETAVNNLQLIHRNDILAPWVRAGLLHDTETPTGYVYKTTQRWINLHMCPSLQLPAITLP